MNKIKLIIVREYLSRVRKRAFIIGTILFPLLYFGLIFGTSYIAVKTSANLRIALIDSSGLFNQQVVDQANGADTTNRIILIRDGAGLVMNRYDSLGYDGYVLI